MNKLQAAKEARTKEATRIRNVALQYFKEPHTIPEWNDYIGIFNNWLITDLKAMGFLEVVGTKERNNRGSRHKIFQTVIETYDPAVAKPKAKRKTDIMNLVLDKPEMQEKYKAQAAFMRAERSRQKVYAGVHDYGSF